MKYSEDEKRSRYDTYYQMGYECGSIDAEHDLFGYHFDMSNKNVGKELWDGYHDDMINAFYDGYSQAQDKYRTHKKDNKSKEN